jgi:hypothetical protein
MFDCNTPASKCISMAIEERVLTDEWQKNGICIKEIYTFHLPFDEIQNCEPS